MLAFSCGHIVLACRQQMIITVRAPQYAKLGCGVAECREVGCKGNRVEEVSSKVSSLDIPNTSTGAAAAMAAALAASLPTYKVLCAHHKNSSKGQPGWEVVVTSPTMTKLLHLYLKHYRSLLLQCFGSPDEDPKTLFFTTQGKAFDIHSLGR